MKLIDLDCPLERCVWAFWGIVGMLALVMYALNTAYPETAEKSEDPYEIMYSEQSPEQRAAIKKEHERRHQENMQRLKAIQFDQAMGRDISGDLEESIRSR